MIVKADEECVVCDGSGMLYLNSCPLCQYGIMGGSCDDNTCPGDVSGVGFSAHAEHEET